MKYLSRLTALLLAFVLLFSSSVGVIAESDISDLTRSGYDQMVSAAKEAAEAEAVAAALEAASQPIINEGGVVYEQDIPEQTKRFDIYEVITDAQLSMGGETEITLPQSGKINLSAGTAAQWQIYIPGADMWVNIAGETGDTFALTYAVIGGMLSGGSAKVRALAGDSAAVANISVAYGSALPAVEEEDTFVAEAAAASTFALRRSASTSDANAGIMLLAEGDEEATTHNIVVNYKFVREADGLAASPYTATIGAGTNFSTTISTPVVMGYVATVDASTVPEGFTFSTEEITINLTNVQQDYTLNVVYQPADVQYTVIHYIQNVDDDNYTLDSTQTLTAKTKSEVGDVEKEITGFYALNYEHPEVAADGSTVVEIYYDRNYYLMNFNLAGGYGVEPIYARYDAPVSVGVPTRAGYAFNGWTPAVPAKVPVNGGTYTAQWEAQNTEYSRTYWVVNDDGTRTYIGSEIVNAESGSVVSGSDTLTANTKVCGLTAHTHDDTCEKNCTEADHVHGDGNCVYVCGLEAHDHTTGCTCAQTAHGATEHTRSCYEFSRANVDDDATDLSNPTLYTTRNGFDVYRVWNSGNYRYYVLIDGSYYRISNYSYNLSLENSLTCHYHTSACCTIKAHEHSATCCNVHVHGEECYSCGAVEHTHGDGCVTDLAKYVQFKKADENVTVEGDGSSIVNVYYEYKTYTIRFIYARQNGNGYQIATLTRDGNLNNCYWQNSSTLPEFIDPSGKTERSTVTIGNYTYYYISLSAKYGEDISELWPDANIGNAGNYQWGSWAAAAGTGYREKYGDEHANIVGPYPTMSEDMIVDDPELLDDGTYLAQNMIAWWAGSRNGVANHAYHNYFELLPGEEKVDGGTYLDYNGKTYKLEETYTFTAAHNGTTRVDPIYFEGYYCVNDSRGTNNDTQANSNNYANNGNCAICGNDCDYCNTFYYDRNIHKLYFWNYNGYLNAGSGEDVAYGDTLSKFSASVSDDIMNQEENYPEGLQVGAYEFGGWYTTVECLDGTEVDWNATMPDADMTLYAKWDLVTHTVEFYLDRAAFDANKKIGETHPDLPVLHGSKVEAEDLPAEPTNNGLNFIGWFYLDENGEEKAFDFANMPINRDMKVYGKWNSDTLVDYKVNFVFVDKDKNEIVIADAIEGSALVGTTKTFDAKVGEELYTGYQEGYFPLTKSSSITMNGNEGADNTFTFYYVQKDAVPYIVRYYYEGTTTPVFTNDDGSEYMVVDADNQKAVVTETFKVKQGYMPDAYQKRLIVDGSESTDWIEVTVDGETVQVHPNNVIIFYYVKDTEHAYYKISHWTETLGGGWEEYGQGTQAPAEIDTKITSAGQNLKIDGFTYDSTLTTAVVGTTETVTNEWVLTAEGLELKLFYTRNSYPYRVEYLEKDTGKVLADPKVTTDGKELAEDLSNLLTGKYSELITGQPIAIENYTVVPGQDTSIQIRIESDPTNASLNVIRIYYTENAVTINYEVVGPNGCGTIDLVGGEQDWKTNLSESVPVLSGNPQGAQVNANAPTYRFVGWFYDEEGTLPVADTGEGWVVGTTIQPQKVDGKNVADTYYAIFEYNLTTLTITKNGMQDIDAGQSFIFTVNGYGLPSEGLKIAINGNGSETISGLTVGQTYTVTEDEGWSWRYTASEQSITLQPSGNELVINNDRDQIYWLDGDSYAENVFGTNNDAD